MPKGWEQTIAPITIIIGNPVEISRLFTEEPIKEMIAFVRKINPHTPVKILLDSMKIGDVQNVSGTLSLAIWIVNGQPAMIEQKAVLQSISQLIRYPLSMKI